MKLERFGGLELKVVKRRAATHLVNARDRPTILLGKLVPLETVALDERAYLVHLFAHEPTAHPTLYACGRSIQHSIRVLRSLTIQQPL